MILVTGATGNVGGAAVRLLSRAGENVRILARDPSRVNAPEGAEVVRGDLGDPDSLEDALKGVDSVFLVWPLLGVEAAREVVDVISRHVGALVYVSSAGVEQAEDPINGDHASVEALIKDSDLRWTMIRGGSFAANDLEWIEQVRSGASVLRVPFPDARGAMVHEDDLASVGVWALAGAGPANTVHTVTGPEALTTAERIGIIGEVLGRPLKVEAMPTAEARAELMEGGLPEEYANAILEAHGQRSSSDHVEPIHTVDAVTGQAPRAYRQWVIDHLDDFR